MKPESARTVRNALPPLVAASAVVIGILLPLFFAQPFFFYAGYLVLQFVVLSYAWDIFGSRAGYINFGTAGFFGVGVYVSGYLYRTYDVGLGVGLLCAGLSSAALGAAVGFATVRLRGLYFAIVTLAMSFVIQAVIINSPGLGESYGLLVNQPPAPHPFPSYVAFLFSVMVAMSAAVALASWVIKRSKFGSGLASIKDDEVAAESLGVPTFRLKVIAATISGFFMGLAGAPFPLYQTYISPDIISLTLSVNPVAMPLIGGAGTLLGPLIGSVLLGTVQQVVSVVISSVWNVVLVGLLIIFFIVVAPDGIYGIASKAWNRRKKG